VFNHEAVHARKFDTAKPGASLKANWIQPELCELIVSLDMYMHRLLAIARVEKEPIRAYAQYGRHATRMNCQ
jgi:hypothetical protein